MTFCLLVEEAFKMGATSHTYCFTQLKHMLQGLFFSVIQGAPPTHWTPHQSFPYLSKIQKLAPFSPIAPYSFSTGDIDVLHNSGVFLIASKTMAKTTHNVPQSK